MKELRNYQVELSETAAETLKQVGIVYLCMEVRTGKTTTALNTIKLCGYKKALFLTKLKAIPSIQADYSDFGFDGFFELQVINNESLHKITGNYFDIVVMDEAHRFGSFPKPNLMTKTFKERFSKLPIILLSGTPHPESYSQIYHQFWVSQRSPFKNYANFYSWFKNMMLVKTEFEMGFGVVANYSNNEAIINKFFDFELRKIAKDDPEKEGKKSDIAILRELSLVKMKIGNDLILSFIEPYLVKYTQADAGFISKVNESILLCDMQPKTTGMINKLRYKRVLVGKEETILADTPAKLMTKIHQLSSGTIKFESGNSMVIDDSKAFFIKERFAGKKIAIFYKFKEELMLLEQVFGDNLCTSLNVFDSSCRSIALQIVSGREGISLKGADCLVYFNIDFSALSYWQSRDRLTTIDRAENNIYWVFSRGGIEQKIYAAVVKKKNYTASIFMKQYGKQVSIKGD